MILSYQRRVLLTAIAMVIALLAVMAALWLPTIPREVKVMDTLFVIDITDSMNVKDVVYQEQTMSRLHWAKEFTHQTLLELPCGSHAGLAIFSEARSLILMNPVEVCDSYNDLLQMLEQVHPYMAWVRSSEISKAIYTAIRQAKEIKPQPTVVFITDGHEAPPIHESLFPKFAGTPGEVRGVLVGIGGEDLLPIPKTNELGEIDGVWHVDEVMHRDVYASLTAGADKQSVKPRSEHLSSQKKSHLETLAKRIGFDFVSSPKQPAKLVKRIKAQSVTRNQLIDYDLYPWLAAMAVLMLGLIFFPHVLFLKIKP